MVSTFWINMFVGMTTQMGLSPSALATLFAFIWSISMALAVIFYFHNDKSKMMGIITFWIFMLLFTLTEAIDWYITIVAGLVFAFLYTQLGDAKT